MLLVFMLHLNNNCGKPINGDFYIVFLMVIYIFEQNVQIRQSNLTFNIFENSTRPGVKA